MNLVSQDTVSGDSLTVQTAQVESGQTIDWSTLETALKPAGFTAAAWNVVFGNLLATVGNTTDSYDAALAGAATYLGGLGATTAEVSDVSRLWSFLVAQANASLPDAALTSAVDASLPTPGAYRLPSTGRSIPPSRAAMRRASSVLAGQPPGK